MKNLTLTQRSTYSPRALAVVAPLALLAMFTVSIAQANAYVMINSQLDFGERNSDVTSLQQFFASMPDVYPQGLVTGYFGSMTRAAVMNFQVKYGIVSSGSPSTTGYGRVGPSTMAKINALMAGGSVSTDVSGPAFYNIVRNISTNTATVSFNTNESTNARIVFSTSPVLFNEGDINSNGFAALTGSSVSSGAGLNTAHTVSIQGLSSNTNYYYTVIATDATGNASVIGPNNVFRTNN